MRVFRNGSSKNACLRDLSEPAGTVFFGHQGNDVRWYPDDRYRGVQVGVTQKAEGREVAHAEASVLQGFPSDHPWHGTKCQRWTQIGNAVPPPLASAVLRQLGIPVSRAVFLFAGPGGACLGAKAVGITGPGIEYDPIVCQTRRAAGLETVEGSVLDYGPTDFHDATGLWGSPPCQAWSSAGKGAARAMKEEVLAAIASMGRGEKPDTSGWPDGATLVLEPLRWAIEAINLGRPYEWIALEQVPPVLPVWEAMADVLRAGYGVATGNLQSEMFGTPQTRKRAILVARLGKPAALPTPTHSRYYPRDPKRLDPGVKPWISMAEALGPVLPGWAHERPATSVNGDPRIAQPGRHDPAVSGSQYGKETVRVTVEEAAVLQSCPRDHPFAGTSTQRYGQVGNMVPCLLAEAVLRAVALDD